MPHSMMVHTSSSLVSLVYSQTVLEHWYKETLERYVSTVN